MRLFVAVDPSAAAVADLSALVRGLRIGGRAKPASWHVTVAFLGEVDDRQLPDVESAAARAAAASRAGRLRIAGGGRFGDAILWAGLDGDLDALQGLAAAVRAEMVEAGVGSDGRPYHPHLTLARRRRGESRADLHADVAALDGYRGPEWPLEQVHLMRSWFGVSEEYERLASWGLSPC